MKKNNRSRSTSDVWLLRVAAVLCVTLVAAISAAACRDNRPVGLAALEGKIEAVGSVREVMHVLDPSADAIWASVGVVVTIEGEREIVPANEEEWLALERHAVTVAEAGNLLMFPGRARDEGEWIERARALVVAGRTALTAIRARDKDAVMAAGEQVTISCDNCHQKYWDDTNVVVE